jgi:hypothetical protein
MSNKKFIIEKETEWKDGETKNWYYIKLIEGIRQTLIHLTSDEDEANKLFESAVTSYTKSSKTVIREHEIEESK